MKNLFSIIIILLSVFCSTISLAGLVVTQQVKMESTSSTPVMVGDMSSIALPVMQPNQIDLFRKGVITFGIDHKYGLPISAYHVKLKLRIRTYTQYGGTPNVYDKYLELDYDPENMLEFDDKKILELTETANQGIVEYDIEILEVEHTDLSTNAVTIYNTISDPLSENLYIYLDIYANRLTDFTTSASVDYTSGFLTAANAPISHDLNSDSHIDEIEITWPSIPGAEEYQLEWVFINDYDENYDPISAPNAFVLPTALYVDFKNNSTRISTSQNTFRISLVFDHGYICYRVRGVGRSILPNEQDVLIFTGWTSPDDGTASIMDSYFVNDPFEIAKNWQYSATYAEEGKKKEVVTFFDGSLRNRQMVTKINTDATAIVGETIYDYQGRPVIQVLPTPAPETTSSENPLQFYPGWSTNTSNGEFTKENFDIDSPTDPCAVNNEPMNTTVNNASGASKYYSPHISVSTDEQGYVPDAAGYPYSQVEYTPDNTGRIRRQGGVGPDFQLGTDHETKYYYGKPDQEQLNELFGAEVGDASHYQKNMVIDANEQTSVSYLDQEGRVIATSLAGIAPTAVEAVDPNATVTSVTVDLFAKDANGVSTSNSANDLGNAIIFTQSALLSSSSSLTVDYSMSSIPFSDACLNGICFNCAYDLRIEITDECGDRVEPLNPSEETHFDDLIGHFTLNVEGDPIFSVTSCSTNPNYTFNENIVTEVLDAGVYYISKTLTVSQEALAQYTEIFIDNSTCLPTYDDLLTQGTSNSTIDCDPVDCATCISNLGTVQNYILTGQGTEQDYNDEVNSCNALCEKTTYVELKRQTLLSDVKPNGQYAEYQNSTGVVQPSNFPLSVLNVSNTLGTGNENWKNPRFLVSGDFLTGNYLNEYWSEDLTERSRIPLQVTLVGNTVTSCIPNVDVLSTDVHYDAPNDAYYTYPEDLADVEDFIENYEVNLHWAKSLITYHPEYPIFGIIKNAENDHASPVSSDPISSEDFDNLIIEVDSWSDAEIGNFLNTSTGAFIYANDPFYANLADYGLTSAAFLSKYNSYVTINGTSYSIEEFATIAKRCGASSFGVSSLPANCDNWGTGTQSQLDDEWLYFRSLYVNFKRELMLESAILASVNANGLYPGYNGCIGEDAFNPFDYGFLSPTGGWPFFTVGQIFNGAQPCNLNDYQLYINKQKRFFSPLDDFDATSQNNAAYQQYLLTGQCPNGSSFQSLLSEVAGGFGINNTSFSLNILPSFNSLIYAMNDFTIPAVVPTVQWNLTNSSTSALEIDMMDNSTLFAHLEMIVPASVVPFDWTTVVSFSGLTYLSTNSTSGYDIFKITAKCDDGAGGFYNVIMTCKTSLPIGNCTFDNICSLNQLGKDVHSLMNAISTAGLLNTTTPQNLQATSSGTSFAFSNFVTTPIQIASYGQTTTQLNFVYNASIPEFSFTEGSSLKRMVMKITSGPVNIGNIQSIISFKALTDNTFELTCDNGTTTPEVFTCEIYFEDNGTTTPLTISACGLPTPALCVGKTYDNATHFLELFDEIFQNQTPNYNMLATMSLDNQLLNQFANYSNLNGTLNTPPIAGFESLTYDINPSCPLTLTIDQALYPGVDFSDITGIDAINLTDPANNYGSYNSFQMTASTNDPTNPTVKIDVTSCIDINICDDCELTGGATMSAMLFEGIGNKSQYIIEDNSVDLYLQYESKIADMNQRHGWTTPSSEFVYPVSYTYFRQNSIHRSTDQLFTFIDEYRYDVDLHGYLTNPLFFIRYYGTKRNAKEEYGRYTDYLDNWNSQRMANSLTTLPIASLETFLTNESGDNINEYFEYLEGVQSNSQTPNDIVVFFSSPSAQDTCDVLYSLYLTTYQTFANNQGNYATCEEFENLYPMLTYEAFVDNGLCCTDAGLTEFNGYIYSFMNSSGCPNTLPKMKDCDPNSTTIDDEEQCHRYWTYFQQAVNYYNSSDHANENNQSLPASYTDFEIFMQDGLCTCVEDYLQYLLGYSNMTLNEAQNNSDVVQTIKDFCSFVSDPEDCRPEYAQYDLCVIDYNAWAVINQAPAITEIYTEQTFYEFNLCNCVIAFCNEVVSITSGTDIPTTPPNIIDLCYLPPPCGSENPFPSDPIVIEVPYEDPCDAFISSNLSGNAWNTYQNELQDAITAFQTAYVEHCMSALENMTKNYLQLENHYTLYYYDQAGNLIKTVPPEGVEFTGALTNSAINQAINSDRMNGTHTEMTEHRLATIYQYNSLNQLIAQSTPDQDKIDIFESTLTNGLVPGLKTTAVQMVTENLGYLSGYITVPYNHAILNKRGYLYKTTNGGENWTQVSNIAGSDLKEIVNVPGTDMSYALGKQGVLLTSKDNGANWDLERTFDSYASANYTPITTDFVALEIKISGANVYLQAATKDGRFFSKNVNAVVIQNHWNHPQFQLPLGLISSYTFVELIDYLIINDTRAAVVVKLNDGFQDFNMIFEKLDGQADWQLSKAKLPEIKSLSMFNTMRGTATGVDGDQYSITTSNLTNISPFVVQKEGSPILEDIVQVFALNQDRRVIRIDKGIISEAYYTDDNGDNWTLLDVGNEDLNLGLVERSASSYDLVAVSKEKTSRIHFETTGNIVVYNQTSIGAADNDFVSVSALVDGSSVRYFGIKTNGTIFASQPHTSGNTDIDFIQLTNASLTSCKEIIGLNNPGSFAIAVRGGANKTVKISTGSTIGSGFSSFSSLTNSGSSISDISDIDVIKESSNTRLALFNNTTNKVATLDYTSGNIAVSAVNDVFEAGSKVISTFDDYIAVTGTNGAIQIKKLFSLFATPIHSHKVARFKRDLNDIGENDIGLVVTGDNGTMLKRSLSNGAANYKIIPVGVTEGLNGSDHYTALNSSNPSAYIITGNNGTVLSVDDASFAVTPIQLSNGTAVSNSYYNVDFMDVDIKNLGTSLGAYIVGSNGTALLTTDLENIPFSGATNLSTEDFAAVEWKENSNFAQAVGTNSSIYTLASLFATKTKNIFTGEVKSVHFANPNIGTVIGESYLLRTTKDGGISWQIHHDPSPVHTQGAALKTAWTVQRIDGKHFALIGGTNTFNVISDGVMTSTFNSLFNSKTVTDINFHKSDLTEGIVLSNSGNYLPIQLLPASGGGYTVQGGYTSSSSPTLSSGLPANTRAAHLFEDKSFVAASYGAATYISPTGTIGASNQFTGDAITGQMNDVFFHDSKDGYIVGDYGKFYVIKNLGSTSAPDYDVHRKLDIEDPIIGQSTVYHIKGISFGSRFDGVYGGNYNNNSSSNIGNTSFVRKLHHEPGRFSSKFYYDRLGRLVISENARQNNDSKFSYTRYDELGRVIEVGEKTENDTGIDPGAPVFKSIFGTYVGTTFVPSVIDDAKMSFWVQFQIPAQAPSRNEVTRSFYDKSYGPIASQLPNSFLPDPLTQRKRIVHVTYEESFDGDLLDETYDHATHYDYDIHGNVTTLLQDNRKLLAVNAIDHHRFKRMDYIFDLVSGNVHRMDYQTGEADQWHHSYSYDADNRIEHVSTTNATPMMDESTGTASIQNEVELSTYWDNEATYIYYDHGPLARTVIGQEDVQGLDYAYTLQGWLKGINSNSLQAANDIGKDGLPGSYNEFVNRDVASFSLHYFTGDYSSVVGSNNSFIADLTSGSLQNAPNTDLYNGNIKRMITTISRPGDHTPLPMGNKYEYDQLQRLRNSESFTGLNLATNNWGTNQSGQHYVNSFTYDGNGNIETQVRHGENFTDVIDDLQYKYNEVNSEKTQNRLYHIEDAASSGDHLDDIDDMGTFTSGSLINNANNYIYDEEGRLIKDLQEDIDNIVWRVDGKVKSIERTPGSGKSPVSFQYDAMGNRIAKHTYDSQNNVKKSTYYMLDAQGNTISTYDWKFDGVGQTITFEQTEKHIYGSSRLGVLNQKVGMLGSQNASYSQDEWTHTIGQRTYEISNHLGNVLAVISDKPIPENGGGSGPIDYYLADILKATDYSPFGVTLEGRNFTLSGAEDYRYGFQGQEMDDEIKGEGNFYNYGARMHDPRVGRFLSLDAYADKFVSYSPYSFAGNTPIRAIDNNGDSVLFYSESGKYLGFSNDNIRYKEKNLLVVIDDRAVDNFNNQYNRKRSGGYKNDNNLNSKQVEAHVAGLEGMGTSFDLNAFESFYNKYKDKRYKNGKAVSLQLEESGIPGKGKIMQTKVEWSTGATIKQVNKYDKNGSITINENSTPYSDNQEASVTTTPNEDGVGGFHTHSPDGNPLPSYNPDHTNADHKARGVWQMVQGEGFFTIHRDKNPYNNTTEPQKIEIRTSGKFTEKQKGM